MGLFFLRLFAIHEVKKSQLNNSCLVFISYNIIITVRAKCRNMSGVRTHSFVWHTVTSLLEWMLIEWYKQRNVVCVRYNSVLILTVDIWGRSEKRRHKLETRVAQHCDYIIKRQLSHCTDIWSICVCHFDFNHCPIWSVVCLGASPNVRIA